MGKPHASGSQWEARAEIPGSELENGIKDAQSFISMLNGCEDQEWVLPNMIV